jgi:hypothetical protein
VIPHPCLDEEWSTTFRKTYRKPAERTKPTANIKLPTGECTFDETMRVNHRRTTTAGGYGMNSSLFDETSWATEGNLHTDIKRTEYRNRYNQKKPFHKTDVVNSHGRKKPGEKYRVYDVVDCNPNTNWKMRAAKSQVYAT